MIVYDKIGSGYNATRKADPYLTERIFELLAPASSGVYMDIGCGTGNYLEALTQKGLNFYGVDPSKTMLNVARSKNITATFLEAAAEAIPIEDNYFDGATAILTTHHWPNLVAGLTEVHRVLKQGSRLIMFTFTPEQMKGYWLYHYFPKMIEKCMTLSPSLDRLEEIVRRSGYSSIKTELYFVKEDLQDHFLYSNKFRPEMYLAEEIRNNASAFSLHSETAEVESGLSALKADIKSGEIKDIIRSFENGLGDYLFLVAIK